MIEKYLISNCLFIIDEFNERYEKESKEDLKKIADEEYSEADLVVRLGYPFRHMATFNMQGKSKDKGNDIVVKKKNFMIEVKLLRNWKSSAGNSNSMLWDPIQKDFNWISDEIKKGKQGYRAFVIGWFNAVDRFSQIVQLGKGSGRFPEIDQEKSDYFPFLNKRGKKTKDIFYMYPNAYKELTVTIPGTLKEV
ncbi:hypothetical protein [Alteribacillus iranensis]|uniref:Uncharacterized protein n=1 Tax=Alteribacillus iranensis TaxID=930128 RepID=A0A1I2BIG5_9BACI|nr:hypothetical protein [Alteribacillus iranensis]SFE54980.1 hypothetical protein SAMN05192532_102279 [Alteribacillus iranensis]